MANGFRSFWIKGLLAAALLGAGSVAGGGAVMAAPPHGYAFHGRDVHYFGHGDMVRWRGGHWNNTCFGGRCGWWWPAGGMWYYYSAPVYPYPLMVSDYTYYAEPAMAAPVAPAPAPMTVAPAPKRYFYCDDPAGYYPTVASCPSGFREAAPPPEATAVPAPVPAPVPAH